MSVALLVTVAPGNERSGGDSRPQVRLTSPVSHIASNADLLGGAENRQGLGQVISMTRTAQPGV